MRKHKVKGLLTDSQYEPVYHSSRTRLPLVAGTTPDRKTRGKRHGESEPPVHNVPDNTCIVAAGLRDRVHWSRQSQLLLSETVRFAEPGKLAGMSMRTAKDGEGNLACVVETG